jgi:hypothetical protein
MSNLNDRLLLTRAALARAVGLDSRDKQLKDLEPTAFLVSTKDRRIGLYAVALAESLKAQQEEN